MFTRGYPCSEPFHISGMRVAPSDSRILQGAAARCASLLQSEDAAVRSTAAEALGRWVKDGVCVCVCVMNYAMTMPISLSGHQVCCAIIITSFMYYVIYIFLYLYYCM